MNPLDLSRMMVRARIIAHLNALRRRFPKHLGKCKIHVSKFGDYKARIFVDKSVWVTVMAELATEVDYGNFKLAVDRDEEKRDDGIDYHLWLARLWAIGRGVQNPQTKVEALRRDLGALFDNYARTVKGKTKKRGKP